MGYRGDAAPETSKSEIETHVSKDSDNASLVDATRRASLQGGDTSTSYRSSDVEKQGASSQTDAPNEKDAHIVIFDEPGDPLNPVNWSKGKKFYTAAVLGISNLIVAMGSSIFSTAIPEISKRYNVSTEVCVLGISLYVFGFATGPVLWAPFSEVKGRRPPLLLGMLGFALFEFGVAVGRNIQTIVVCRYFAGVFAASPLTVIPPTMADFYVGRAQGPAIMLFTITTFCGTYMGPFIGGFIVMNESLGWRWTQYLCGILGCACLASIFLLYGETYHPVVLANKAAVLRRRTGNWALHAKHEELEVNFSQAFNTYLARPIKMLCFDPIVLFLGIFLAFVYGLLYLFLTAYPIVYQDIRGFSPGVGGLPYLSMAVGQLLAGVAMAMYQPWYDRKLKANNGKLMPEWRLPVAIPGAIAFSIALFWFGWSGYRSDISWVAPTLSGVFSGFGMMAMFLPPLIYLVDVYGKYAASAVAANTIIRSAAGAIFPLFATYMFDSLHVQWASTLLGCFAALLVPIPIVLYYYGERIRQKSRMVPTD